MIDKSALWTDSRGLYSSLLDQNFNALPVEGEFLLENIRETYAAYPFVWLLYPSRDGALIKELTDAEGLVHCELAVDEWGFALERLARSGARCASVARRLEFANNIRLTWSGISLRDELLRFEASLTSVDDYLLANYSLAVHVINPRNGERVAQGDVGAGPSAIATISSGIDISALPPGDYELQVALYDWQTGARLSAKDLVTDEVSDIHTCIASSTIEQLRVKSLNAKLLWLSVFLKSKSILERSCQQARTKAQQAAHGCGPCYPCCWPPHWSRSSWTTWLSSATSRLPLFCRHQQCGAAQPGRSLGIHRRETPATDPGLV